LGDVFASVFSIGFAVNLGSVQTYFQVTPNTELWVAGYIPGKGSSKKELVQGIERKIESLISVTDNFVIQRVRLVVESDLANCLKKLEELSLDYLLRSL